MAGRDPKIVMIRSEDVSRPPRQDSGVDAVDAPGVLTVEEAWATLLRKLDDDRAHQEFIRACVAAGRVKFALDSYRRLQKLRPADPRIERALGQLRTMFEVASLGDRRSGPHRGRRMLRAVIALVVALLAAAALLTLAQLMVRQGG